MNLTGCSYEVEGFDEYLEITEAIISDKKIAFDYDDNGWPASAVMYSVDGGTFYKGLFGTPKPESHCTIEGLRFTAKSGEILLWLKWHDAETGFGGRSIVHLASDWEE